MTIATQPNKEQIGSPFSTANSPMPDAAETEVAAVWREKTADEITASDLIAAGDILRKTALIGEPKWKFARAGAAAEAISVAVANWPVTVLTPRVDLIMTALMYSAMMGSAAAALVMSHSLRQVPAAKKHHKRIAASWLVRNIVIAAERSARRPSAPIRIRKRSRDAAANGAL
jgi:hypothetical protein